MEKSGTSCNKVSDMGFCVYCKSKAIVKNGFTKNKKRQYYCKSCSKRFIDYYCNNAYKTSINQNIIQLTKEGLGIRSTSRVLQISTTTVLKRIIAIARSIPNPVIPFGKTYEVDEMRTYVSAKSKLIWIVYALEQETRNIISFNVGRRTNKTLGKVITSLELSEAKTIFTDKLKNYRYLISKVAHNTKHRGINHIERKNLSIRTHLKRLNRRTICFSRSFVILVCVLRIYFWG